MDAQRERGMMASKKRDLEGTKRVPLVTALPLLDDLRQMIDQTRQGVAHGNFSIWQYLPVNHQPSPECLRICSLGVTHTKVHPYAIHLRDPQRHLMREVLPGQISLSHAAQSHKEASKQMVFRQARKACHFLTQQHCSCRAVPFNLPFSKLPLQA